MATDFFSLEILSSTTTPEMKDGAAMTYDYWIDRFPSLWLLFLLLPLSPTAAFQGNSAKPATAVDAAAVLDLAEFELIAPVDGSEHAVVASQQYLSRGNVTDTTAQLRARLTDRKWKELEGATVSDQYASASFGKEKFSISLSVFPASQPGQVSVSINNHGNVDLKTLPMPEGSKLAYALPMSVMLFTERPVKETISECQRLLSDAGWEPFGTTTVSFFVKQNAVRLQVMISESPAQQGKTAIQVTSEQLSYDFAVPPNAQSIQYTDSTGQLVYETAHSREVELQWFKSTLSDAGWKATTESLVKVGFREIMIFRNSAGGMTEVTFQDVEDKIRVFVKFQTPAQAAREQAAAEVAVAKKQAEIKAAADAKMNPAVIEIASLPGAVIKSETGTQIELETDSGGAKKVLDPWVKKMTENGWVLNRIVDQKEVGQYELTRDKAQIDVGLVDPGFISGSITITTRGDFRLKIGAK